MAGVVCLCWSLSVPVGRFDLGGSKWLRRSRFMPSLRQEAITLNGKFIHGCVPGSRHQARAEADDFQHDEAKLGHKNSGGVGSWTVETSDVVKRMGTLLDGESVVAAEAAGGLVSSIGRQGRAALLSALFSSAPDSESDLHFSEADMNSDGVVDRAEFSNYVEAQAVKLGTSTKPLTMKQLLRLGLRAGIGMIGFGFTDNAIMIIAGDAIQNSIGQVMGLTTLLSAGLGNAVADLVGTAFRGYIERVSNRFMPEMKISSVQMTYKEAWWAETVGSSIGVTVGCLLGLIPLILINNQGKNPPVPSASEDCQVSSASVGSNSTVRYADGKEAEKANVIACADVTGKGLFASVSSPPSCVHVKHQAGDMSYQLGTLVFVLLIALLTAARRLKLSRPESLTTKRMRLLKGEQNAKNSV